MAQNKLTKRSVDAARPSEKRYEIWDSELPGFGVRIAPTGRKTYMLRYRPDGGGRSSPKRYFTIGSADVLTTEQAREKAHKLLGAILNGADPALELKAKRALITMSDLIEQYARDGAGAMQERTRKFTLARLRHHAVPLLGKRKVNEITVADVERFVRDITNGKTAITERRGPRSLIRVTGGKGAAAKAVRDLSAVFTYAIRCGLVTVNPCTSARKPSDGRRDRYLSLDEVRRMGEALDAIDAEGGNTMGTNIIRLLALTGCRRNEIAGLKWFEIDFDQGLLRLEQTKTGKSIRPIGAPALALLSGLPRHEGTEFVFPALTGANALKTHYQDVKSVWAKVKDRAGLSGAVIHTLRHTLGSAAISAGESLAVTGALLGHANARSTNIYAHLQEDPARRAADRVTGGLAAALNNRDEADVIPISTPKGPAR